MTKKEIEEEVKAHEGHQAAPALGAVPDVEAAPLSPTSRLRKNY